MTLRVLINFLLSVLVIMLLASCTTLSGKSKCALYRVPDDFSGIQEAVDAACDNDTVVIGPGIYPGGIELAGKAITLASEFHLTGELSYIDKTVIGSDSGGEYGIRVDATASGSVIKGFNFRGTRDGIRCYARISVLTNYFVECVDGIDYEGGGGMCRGNIFEHSRDDAIDLDWDCEVLIEDNVIRHSMDDGIEIRLYPYEKERTLNILVRGNTITDSGEDGIQIIDHKGPSCRVLRIEHNFISGSAMAAVGCMDDSNTKEDFRAARITDKIYFINNTFIDNHYGITCGGKQVFVKNIFLDTEKSAIKGLSEGATITHNLFRDNGIDLEYCNASLFSKAED